MELRAKISTEDIYELGGNFEKWAAENWDLSHIVLIFHGCEQTDAVSDSCDHVGQHVQTCEAVYDWTTARNFWAEETDGTAMGLDPRFIAALHFALHDKIEEAVNDWKSEQGIY